jgi:hypothetical protein
VNHIQHELNLLAVLVSALILWFLGALWFSPALFAKPWMAMVGIKKEAANQKSMIFGMVASFIGDVVVAFVLAHLVLWSNAPTFGWGAMLGFICWGAFFGAPNLPQSIYEGRPFKLFAITNGYWLVGLILIGGVLAVWR